MKSNWYLYIVRCSDNSLYTGITKNIAKRVDEHNSGGRLSAKYTRTRRPVELVYSEVFSTRSDAAKREYEIKQLDKNAKELLASSYKDKLKGHTRS